MKSLKVGALASILLLSVGCEVDHPTCTVSESSVAELPVSGLGSSKVKNILRLKGYKIQKDGDISIGLTNKEFDLRNERTEGGVSFIGGINTLTYIYDYKCVNEISLSDRRGIANRSEEIDTSSDYKKFGQPMLDRLDTVKTDFCMSDEKLMKKVAKVIPTCRIEK